MTATQELAYQARIRELKEEKRKVDELMNILTEAIIAMANDGWLYFGPEGMTKPQEKCYRAYQLVMKHRVEELK